jgi:hypothetical protein
MLNTNSTNQVNTTSKRRIEVDSNATTMMVKEGDEDMFS